MAPPLVIAMKGHPATGKTTLARSIAVALRIPLLDKDDIRDATLFLHPDLPSSSLSLLNDLSYDALSRLAATQLRLGLSVVIDSPLSRRHLLDRLLRIAAAASARVVIVECRPSDEGEWRRRLEKRGEEERVGHKPSTWRDMERLMEGYGGCTEYDVGDVPKVVVDTTGSHGVEEMVSSVLRFIESLGESSSTFITSSAS